MSDYKTQWWSLRRNLALSIAIMIIAPCVGYHYIFKQPIVKEKIVEVVKEVEVIKNGYECAYIRCFNHRGYSLHFQKGAVSNWNIYFVIRYKNKKQK